jgi:hypothetical protein
MMATLYLDTEFNGFAGDLMSLALVAEDGREWYGVLGLPGEIDGWVYDNVLPALFSLRPTIGPTDEVDFRASLLRFLKQFDCPTIIADWYSDLHQFFGLFAGGNHTESWAYACRAELVLLDKYESEFPHNALSDARAIRAALSRAQAEGR